jgi:predicted nucleic-acid-binding protein
MKFHKVEKYYVSKKDLVEFIKIYYKNNVWKRELALILINN